MNTHQRLCRHLASALLLCLPPVANAQSPVIQEIINAVNLDSLVYTVNVLSGEIGSKNGGMTDTIYSRVNEQPGHDLARDHLKARFEGYGLSAQLHPFTLTFPGVNVLAEQPGTTYPDIKYILCAHYDSYAAGVVVAPGADDNASGVAAVLEAARLLSRYKTTYTVLYALWDEEELGRRGSSVYATEARARGDSILGVINLDMIGYDGDNDSVMELHGRAYANTGTLIDTVAQVQTTYGLGLKPLIYYPNDIIQSDYGSFYSKGYGALWIVHGFWNKDSGPYYHTTDDRTEHLSLPYFQEMAKLAVGTIALLADVQGTASVPSPEMQARAFSLEQNYPNPFNPVTRIQYTVGGTRGGKDGTRDLGLGARRARLVVYDLLGRQVATLVDEEKAPGSYEARFDGSGLSSGVYFYRLAVGEFVQTRKLVLLH